MRKIIRVFPRRTKTTPADPLAYVGGPDMYAEADEVRVSVAFTWDLPEAERLEKEWRHVAPTSVGGPATGRRGENFTPGLYLKKGYVITSRGCGNRCWFCSVWKREGGVRELPVTEGWNVLDDNLLACSEGHVRSVFAMLAGQKKEGRRIEFTGGLEAALLRRWHAEELRKLRPYQMFFAYDDDGDRDPLFEAGKLLQGAGFSKKAHVMRAYVLIGYRGDTFEKAERRLNETMAAGFLPMAMLWRGEDGAKDAAWGRFQTEWARPAIMYRKSREAFAV